MSAVTTSAGGDGSLETSVLRKQVEDLQGQIVALTSEFEAAKAEAVKMKDLAGRAQADLQNAKARVDRERTELAAFALEAILRKLLPIIDSFQRAFQHLPEALANDEWTKGVVAIERQLARELEAAGLQKMSSLGAPLDPQRHEVLQQGSGKKDAVIEVYEEGYELHGRVLRPAKVKIGDGSSKH
ncbi:nucleotide exchange factor GrpE [Candidatus Peribacteria bacterium]|nr:nucleotide exchange factor GrpE [Candidatus Peribacteria bacterium]